MSLYAAVDCGTNSTRLLIGDGAGSRVVEELRFTKLGEGVHGDRRISDAAAQRTIDALGEYHHIIEAHSVAGVRAVATSAARDAANGAEVLQHAGEALGAEVELIDGEEEAALTYVGASLGCSDEWTVVVDIGGGSTEVILGRGARLHRAQSFDIGSVRVTEKCGFSNPPTRSEVREARSWIREILNSSDLLDEARANSPLLVGTAAPPTTLASVELGAKEWDFSRVHGYRLSAGRIETLLENFCLLPTADLAQQTGMHQGRAGVIVGGVLVLSEVTAALGVDHCSVSGTDLLDGLICTLL